MADVTLAKVDTNENGGLMNIMSIRVKVEADHMVQQIVPRGDGTEHGLDVRPLLRPARDR